MKVIIRGNVECDFPNLEQVRAERRLSDRELVKEMKRSVRRRLDLGPEDTVEFELNGLPEEWRA